MKKYTNEIEKQMKDIYKMDASQEERDEQVLQCVDLILEDGDDLEKAKKSVRGKLASMQHYVRATPAAKSGKQRTGKADLIKELASIWDVPVEKLADLSKATIPPLTLVVANVKADKARLEELENPTQEQA